MCLPNAHSARKFGGAGIVLPAPRRIINPSVLDFSVKPREPRLEPHDIKQPSFFLHNAERVANMTASISGRAAAFLNHGGAHSAGRRAYAHHFRASRAAHISQSRSGSLKALVREVDQREYQSDVCSQHVAWHLRLKTCPDPAASECLLTLQWDRFIEINPQNSHLEGAYGHLYRDLMFEIEELIRAGKVAGESRNFGVRGEEHRTGATLTQPNPTSLYYKCPPSTEVM